MPFSRYVAVGDSSTEGLDDPDGRGGYRGWADRLAEIVARAQHEPLEYANLAIRGRMAREILEEQLPVAVKLEPDLATVVAGMNDLIRPRLDTRSVVRDIETMFAGLRGVGAVVVTFTLPSPGPGMPIAKLLLPRVRAFNAALRAAARRTGTLVLDLERHPVASDPRLWSEDRLHGNTLGHERVAHGLAHTLGIESVDDSWAHPLPRRPVTPLTRALAADAAWVRTHLVPWAKRHLRGESSGDGVSAKRPEPLPVMLSE